MNTACTYRLTQHLVLLIVAILAAAPGMAQGGTLRIGSMTRENGNYVVPIVLSGAEDQVSALDFRLTYDPAVFQPVAAESGPAAAQANKVVTANSPAPGDYMVVMMGLNQTTVPQGEVAKIIMQQVSNPDGGQSELVIRDPTLATAGGVEIPSRGMSRTVDFADAQPEKPEPEDPAPTEETPEEEVPAEESAGDAINTGLEPDPGEVSENSTGRKSGPSRFAQGPLPAAGSTTTPRNSQQSLAEQSANLLAKAQQAEALRQGLPNPGVSVTTDAPGSPSPEKEEPVSPGSKEFASIHATGPARSNGHSVTQLPAGPLAATGVPTAGAGAPGIHETSSGFNTWIISLTACILVLASGAFLVVRYRKLGYPKSFPPKEDA